MATFNLQIIQILPYENFDTKGTKGTRQRDSAPTPYRNAIQSATATEETSRTLRCAGQEPVQRNKKLNC